ncbi:MAG TPA: protein translocase subunit SecF, partial [bacterium]|nr:protein translocase subunit SecF [bacterium]
ISKLQENFGTVKELRFEGVGPTVSKELTQKTIWAVLLASLAIILYLAWAFRNVPAPTSSWRFGICAIAALLHDVLFVLGVYSILGHFYNVEIDILFLPAILTVMSFSVHDSIVVFDRIRENLRKYTKESFEEVVNISVNETLVRSLNVSLTVVITLLALYLFGAESIKPFLFTLIIGLISGTYSSIFNASPLLVTWHYFSNNKK